jgi:F-type H+-transporting ATPase subunit gamma
MASLKELKTRISSVKSTQKITSAMKMMSIARLKKAQLAIKNALPFSQAMHDISNKILFDIKLYEKIHDTKVALPEIISGKDENNNTHLLFVFASDRGLCGNYNSEVSKAAIKIIKNLEEAGKNIKIVTVNKKATDSMKKLYPNYVIKSIENLGKEKTNYEETKEISQEILSMFEKGEISSCSAVYTQYESAVKNNILHDDLLPLKFENKETSFNIEDNPNIINNAWFEFEPSSVEILKQSADNIFTSNLYSIVAHAQCSEHSKRMMSMDSATNNAADMINNLSLEYNRTRQAAITTELVEIISGAEAL